MNALPSAVKAMLHTGPSWFWMTDENHCLTGLSNRLYALSGEKPEDYLGKSRMDFIAGIAAYTPGGHAHRKQLEAREPFRDFTYQHSFTKLKLTWISASGDPVFDDDGVFCGYQGTAVAISPALEHASTSLSAERALLAQKIELQSKVDAYRRIGQNRWHVVWGAGKHDPRCHGV